MANYPILIKKYSNRRLYDTAASRYITLEELAETIRKGNDVQVRDAKSGQDLTQATLTQIILESRGAGRLLPVPLLLQLIRMGDTALADFMGRYISWALEIYQRTARRMRLLGPFGQIPFPMPSPFASYDQHDDKQPWAPAEGDEPYGEEPYGEEPPDEEAPPPPPPSAPPAKKKARRPKEKAAKAPPAPEPGPSRDDVASLRHELDELKRLLLDRAK